MKGMDLSTNLWRTHKLCDGCKIPLETRNDHEFAVDFGATVVISEIPVLFCTACKRIVFRAHQLDMLIRKIKQLAKKNPDCGVCYVSKRTLSEM